MKRITLMDEYMNQPVYYGGFVMRRSDVIRYLDEVAKTYDKKNYLAIRDAGLLGNYQYNELHGYPPDNAQTISLDDFKEFIKQEV